MSKVETVEMRKKIIEVPIEDLQDLKIIAANKNMAVKPYIESLVQKEVEKYRVKNEN